MEALTDMQWDAAETHPHAADGARRLGWLGRGIRRVNRLGRFARALRRFGKCLRMAWRMTGRGHLPPTDARDLDLAPLLDRPNVKGLTGDVELLVRLRDLRRLNYVTWRRTIDGMHAEN